jgi:23S rRNA pseudouridine1911/1915/1917 synthase
MKKNPGPPEPLARVTPEEAGERLDRFLARRLAVPRNRAQGWIHGGHVTVNDTVIAKPAYTMTPGERISCQPPPPVEERVVPEPGELVLLYEDEHLVALDKPAGLTVHPGAGQPTGTLAHRLLAHYPEMAGVGGPGRPGIVHRLDRGTSGVMLAARSDRAYQGLSQAFARREVEKHYLAVVYGVPKSPTGRIDTAIGRHPERRKEMTVFPAVVPERRSGGRSGSRPALTLYRIGATLPGLAFLDVEILTGRTHQIRVHLKSIGHPLVGDGVYGEKRWKGLPGPVQGVLKRFPRPALHAWRLALEHPVTGQPLALEAPLPMDLRTLWRDLVAASPGPEAPRWTLDPARPPAGFDDESNGLGK